MPTDHGKLARELFYSGANCAQAVFGAFSEELGMPRDAAFRLASSFGGGMGRLREVCGCCSAMFMAAGAFFGYDDVEDPEKKHAHYALIRELAERFRLKNGSLICRELLADLPVTTGGDADPRTPEYYNSRPCPGFVEDAARILEELLHEQAWSKTKEAT